MLESLAKRLELPPDEARRALALAAILFAIGASYTLARTVRDAFFLAHLPATVLPWVYIGVGVLAAVASIVYARATRRRSLWESLAGGALVASLSLAAFAAAFRTHAAWLPVAFYLWVNLYGLILISQFWVFASGMSNAREAKRTFGIVGLGGILGGLAGGLVATPLARMWELSSLLNVAAVLQALAVPLVYLSAHRAEAASAEPIEAGEVEPGNPLASRYVRWLAVAALCSVAVTGMLDYQFKVEIQRRFPGPSELASFLGLFHTASNLGAITLQLFATRWFIQRVGAGWSASLLPAGTAIGTVFTIVAPGFAPVTAMRLWDQMTRMSINKAAGQLFFFPIEPALRRRAKALIEAGIERVGDGLAGLVILLAGVTIGASTRNVAIVVAVLLLVWVAAWMRVRVGYVAELAQNLRRLHLDHRAAPISLREASLMKEMKRLLESRYERIVLHGIDLMEETAPEELERHVPGLLAHGSPRIRARALVAVRVHRLAALEQQCARLIDDEDAEVRVQALGTRAALSGGNPIEPMREFLESPDQRLRVAAILAVVEQIPCELEERLRGTLDRLLRDGTRADRLAVTEALGRRTGTCPLHDLLTPLLGDPDLAVRRAALRSAGAAQRRSHVPVLIESLGARETEEAARQGLAAMGDRVVGTLGDYLSDSGVAPPIRLAIPRVLGSIHTQDSVSALFRCRERSDGRLVYRVLKAENRIRASGARVEFPRGLIREDLEHDVRSHLFALVHYRTCPLGKGRRSAERLLCIALNERMEHSLNRVFRRLGLLYPPHEMLAAYQGAVSESPRMRANALEYLDQALAPEHRSLVLPLVDDVGDEGRMRLAEQRYGMRYVSYEQTLEAVVDWDDPWLRACALYVIGVRKDRALLPLVESHRTTLDRLVRETAEWARLAIVTG